SQPSTLNPQPLYNEEWLEDTGLAARIDSPRRPNLDRDFGEYFTTAQTAQLLKVNKNAVHCLPRPGPLTGWQKPPSKEHGFGNRWWFYKKEDVYNLLADGEHRKRHKRAKGSSAH